VRVAATIGEGTVSKWLCAGCGWLLVFSVCSAGLTSSSQVNIFDAPIMRADERKCKFHACLAPSSLDFVLLNYIVLIFFFISVRS
jgi:hypothetical protein